VRASGCPWTHAATEVLGRQEGPRCQKSAGVRNVRGKLSLQPPTRLAGIGRGTSIPWICFQRIAAVSGERDRLVAADHDVARSELAATPGLDLTVHTDLPRLEQAACGAAGLDEVHQLEQLPEPDAALPHLDVHGRDVTAQVLSRTCGRRLGSRGRFRQSGRMQLDVDTAAVEGVADAVRRTALGLGAVDLPRPPPCEDVGASDAIGALLAVSGEVLDSCRGALDSAAQLVDTAAVDYARGETRAVPLP
jgi:hypothetical protein